jgi:phage-related protein
MATDDDWAIESYVDDRGASPVEAFFDSLDTKTRARFRWSLVQLQAQNIRAREPLARHVQDDLWELRERSDTNIYRVIYFFFRNRRIVLLHGFQKKTQRTPRREIEMARKRQARFLDRARKGNGR